MVDMVSGIMDELRSLWKDVEDAKKAPNARMDSIEASVAISGVDAASTRPASTPNVTDAAHGNDLPVNTSGLRAAASSLPSSSAPQLVQC